ncbi:MAG: RidA family protein [Verrucomicrobiae bacterium]|nr:RidA family protein [Verrucomicrobiae bacterium]
MKSRKFVVWGTALGFAAATVVAQDTGLKYRFAPESGDCDLVEAHRGALVHTRQATATAEGGLGDLFKQLGDLCRAAGADLDDAARLNLYASTDDPALLDAVRAGVRGRWQPGVRMPAVTLVVTPLPGGARVAGDAVVWKKAAPDAGPVVEHFQGDTATMPPGRDIFHLSGRAAKADTLAEATRGTVAELLAVLKELGGRPADAVRIKAFVQPMSDWQSVHREIEAAFGESGAPPVVLVEWTSSLPTEIEMIAAAPDRAETEETLTFFTPSGDKASPVFSRVARVHGDTLLYTRGIVGTEADTPDAEVKSAFARLDDFARGSGSDLRHLVKATYYVSDDAVSKAHNEIRPHVFDPARPPAASKVAVKTLADRDRGLLMDFIAVPAPKGGK